MGRIISERFLGPDDPIFNGGVEFFSVRRPKPPVDDAPVVVPVEDLDEPEEDE